MTLFACDYIFICIPLAFKASIFCNTHPYVSTHPVTCSVKASIFEPLPTLHSIPTLPIWIKRLPGASDALKRQTIFGAIAIVVWQLSPAPSAVVERRPLLRQTAGNAAARVSKEHTRVIWLLCGGLKTQMSAAPV